MINEKVKKEWREGGEGERRSKKKKKKMKKNHESIGVKGENYTKKKKNGKEKRDRTMNEGKLRRECLAVIIMKKAL